MLFVFDHNERSWARRKKKENGAGTYSKDLVNHQVPKFKGWSDRSVFVLSTCQKFNKIRRIRMPRKVDWFIQYLHTYPYISPLSYINRIRMYCRNKVVFITAYKSFHTLMIKKGIKSVWAAMSIDVKKVQQHAGEKKHNNRIIYFGNIYRDKLEQFEELKVLAAKHGYELDWICDGMFCGERMVSQEEAWKLISEYRYGIGVGRCAMEMMALGVKVMICGNQFGGLIMDMNDWHVQDGTNFNGRCITFDRDIDICFECLSEAMDCSGLVRDISTENHLARLLESGKQWFL